VTKTLKKPAGLPSFAAGVVVALLALTLTVHRADAAQDASAFIANLGAQGVQALAPGVSALESTRRLRQLLQEDFDIPGIGLFALGRYRSSTTPQEQQEFFRLYPDFTVQAFGARLKEYGGTSFQVTNRRSAGNETVVGSEIVRSDGRRVSLDWYLTDSTGQYRITDVTVGGLSMRIALRDQFVSWIENNRSSFGAFLTVLRQQVAQTR